MGWAGRQIKPTRQHVPMPRRWVWLHVADDDLGDAIVDGQRRRLPTHVRLAHTLMADGRARHGRPMRRAVRDVWETLDEWIPRRGRLWVWGWQPELLPWALGLHLALAERRGLSRKHTRISSDSFVANWERGDARVVAAHVAGALPGWRDDGRGPIRAMRDDVIGWAAQVEHLGLGRMQATMGGQAWEAYRARWCGADLWAGGSPNHQRMSRDALVGGIAHAFRLGYDAREWFRVDMTRCYRAVMRDEELPLRSVSYLTCPSIPVLTRAVERDCVVASVLLEDRGLIAPERDDVGHLSWLRGRGWATLTTPDLADALALGGVLECSELATWTRGRPLRALARGVQDIERAGKALGGVYDGKHIKGLSNAVYGRLAMRSRRWRKFDVLDDPGIREWSHWDMDTKRHVFYRQIGYEVERESEPTEHQWGHPAAAAHVTAHGRARLRRLIDRAGIGHVAYVDTDGAIVDADGLMLLQESDLWDELELRIDARGAIDIRGVRDYDIGDVRIQSGVPHASRK